MARRARGTPVPYVQTLRQHGVEPRATDTFDPLCAIGPGRTRPGTARDDPGIRVPGGSKQPRRMP